MKIIYITISHFFYFLWKKKLTFFIYISLSIAFSIYYSLKVLPQYTAQLSFVVDNSWDNWWLAESEKINLSNISSFKLIFSKDSKSKFEAVIKSPKIMSNFLNENTFDEESYFYGYENNKQSVLKKFRLSLGLGKDRITDIFYITLQDKNMAIAEENLNNYLNYVNKIIIDREIDNINLEINQLNSVIENTNIIKLSQEAEEKYKSAIIARNLLSTEIRPPLNIIDDAYSSVFRTYPKRGSTVIFLTFFFGILFLIIFMKPSSDSRLSPYGSNPRNHIANTKP